MKLVRFVGTVLTAAVLLAANKPSPAANRSKTGPLDAGQYIDHVKYLASPELKGRASGTPEFEKAGKYLVSYYKSLGLAPAFGSSYQQPFQITTAAKMGAKNRLADPVTKAKLKAGDDFTPMNFSAAGKVTAPLVFAGYGITAPELNYDDYTGIDAKGKVVVVLRYEPQDQDERSIFAGRDRTRHAAIDAKAINAKMHGAVAVILIDQNDRDKLQPFGKTSGPSDAGIPYVQVKASVAEKWFGAAKQDLKKLIADIDGDLKPRSFAWPDTSKVALEADVVRETKTVNNVGAYLKGETDEYVVIGSHYDHLGLGEQFSLAPSMAGQPHVGADDNASGTAGTLELARYFSGQPKPKRGILFLNFAAEEIGLLGSAYFTEHPSMPLDKCAAMINLDMIGRMKEGAVVVGGVGSGSGFKAMMDRIVPKHPSLKIEYSEQQGVGGSDHMSFAAKRIPNLFFFTGLHMDYHRPTDTWDKINSTGAVELLDVVQQIAGEITAASGRPEFIKATAPAGASAAASSGGGGGYGPSFGSIPDMAFQGTGVKFSDLREGSPAAKAGLKAGDVMIEFDGKKIDNLYDFTYALRGKKVGDQITVKVIRAGETLEVPVKLEARR